MEFLVHFCLSSSWKNSIQLEALYQKENKATSWGFVFLDF